MTAISIKEAKAKLPELIHKLKPGDEVMITDENVSVARLLPAATPSAKRKLGSVRGTVTYWPQISMPRYGISRLAMSRSQKSTKKFLSRETGIGVRP